MDLHIFENDRNEGFQLAHKISLEGKEIFHNCSTDFFFKLVDGLKDPDTLIFTNKFQVFELNFKT